MQRVEILIMGSRFIKYKTGCCGSRTQRDIILNYIPRLYRRFGQRRVGCRYIGVEDPEAQRYEEILAAIKKREMGLPLALRDHQVILHGQDTLFRLPDYIQEALEEMGSI